MDVDLEPHEALVRVHDTQVGGLIDDRTVCSPASFQDVFGPDTQVLFVCDSSENDIAAQVQGFGVRQSDQGCGNTALHVCRASSIQLPVLDFAAQRVTFAAHQSDGIDVTVKHQRLAAPSPA